MGTGERITLIDAVLDLARAQLDVHEATGANDGVPSDRYMGGRHEPWCGHWIAWLFRQCGAPIPGDVTPTPRIANPLASVIELAHVFEREGWMRRAPTRGDLLFLLERGRSDKGPGHHVALIERVTPTTIHCLSGNWGNEVARHTVGLHELVLAGDDRKRPVNCMGFGRRPEPTGWRFTASAGPS